jgi:hypothetical protein
VFDRVIVLIPTDVELDVHASISAMLPADVASEANARIRLERTPTRDQSEIAALVREYCVNGVAVVAGHIDLYAAKEDPKPLAEVRSLLGETVRVNTFDRVVSHRVAEVGAALRTRPLGGHLVCVAGAGHLHHEVLDTAFDAFCYLGPAARSGQLMERLPGWVAALNAGASIKEIRSSIQESGAAGPILDQVLASALSSAARPREAWSTLQAVIPEGGDAEADFLAHAARLAIEADDTDAARDLVQRVVGAPLASHSALRSGVQVARHLGLQFADGAARRLLKLYPGDPTGLTVCADILLRRGSADEAVALLEPYEDELDGEPAYLLAVSRFRATFPGARVEAFIGGVALPNRQRAVADALWSAAEHAEWGEAAAAEALIEDRDPYAKEVLRALAALITKAARTRSGGAPEREVLDGWTGRALRLLGQCPDHRARMDLEDVFDATVLGAEGIAVLVRAIATPNRSATGTPAPVASAGDARESEDFVRFIQANLPASGAFVLAPQRLPEDISSERSEALRRGGFSLLDYCVSGPDADDEMVVVAQLTAAALLDVVATAHGVDKPKGAALAMAVLHMLCVGLAVRRHAQAARDGIEAVLQIASDVQDDGVRADAFIALADVRARLHARSPALFALAVASTVLGDDPVRRQRYHSVATRLLRDIGLIRAAAEQLGQLRHISTKHPEHRNHERDQGLWRSLVLVRAERADPDDRDAVAKDLRAVVDDCKQVLGDRFKEVERLVVMSHLTSAVAHLRALGLSDDTVEKGLVDLAPDLEGLRRLHPGAVASLPLHRVTLADVKEAFVAARARYAADAPDDARNAVVLARRFLAQDDAPVAEYAAALAVLSDLEHGFVETPAPHGARRQERSLRAVFERAREGLAVDGLTEGLGSPEPGAANPLVSEALAEPIGFLARLCALTVDGVFLEVRARAGDGVGRLSVWAEDADWCVDTDIDWDRLHAYRRVYPYAYHQLEGSVFDRDAGVLESMEGLHRPALRDEATLRIRVLDDDVGGTPANLEVLSDGRLVGDVLPVCDVPSLTALLSYPALRDERVPWSPAIWVLGEDAEGSFGPLSIAADQLVYLEELGATLTRARDLADVKSSDVMWMVAHGGLGAGGRHLAVITDDDERRYSPDDLVDACDGASLVVLLVCSGGRHDTELLSARLRGLPAQLLRRGVRTVVASPWPLDVLVGTRWSDHFMTLLLQGVPTGMACFRANQRAGDRHAKDRLAMHVFGDPWLTVVPRAG